MSDAPYIPFYTSDFLAGTGGMTAATKGVYITIICMIYEAEKPLPQSWETLARRCGCTLPAFKRAVGLLVDDGKVEVLDGAIWSEKCAKHLAQRRERSKSAKAAANSRWQKTEQKQSGADANASSAQCQPEPEPEPEEVGKPTSSAQGNLNHADKRQGEGDATPDHDAESGTQADPIDKQNGSGGGNKPDREADKADAASGCRVPDDFWPDSTTQRVFAECGGTDLGAWVEQFVDYWRGVSGAKGTKRDWQSTARNRIRACVANGWAEPGLSAAAGRGRGGNDKPPGRQDIEDHFAAAARVGAEWGEEIEPMGTAAQRPGGMVRH